MSNKNCFNMKLKYYQNDGIQLSGLQQSIVVKCYIYIRLTRLSNYCYGMSHYEAQLKHYICLKSWGQILKSQVGSEPSNPISAYYTLQDVPQVLHEWQRAGGERDYNPHLIPSMQLNGGMNGERMRACAWSIVLV